ncbi:MAG TPA: MazG-like family protein [Bacillota bacterium]|nr:MazG-like family protein [Clostridiaceae bacterium]HNR03531.1 MazG-like family protein [Bacillota bacterium]HNT02695.1 MazG-like family protein [Bacillota bacterium]HPA55350.1 MazG-like family protein [Bacillota bacterium]HPW41875.1 MazG-like family protein [Bacillota bacterium]
MNRLGDTEYKSISLPRLNNLKPNIESTALKLMEEAGELAQLIGKYRGLNGEKCRMEERQCVDRIAEELLDVAQVAISMMFVLEESYSIDIQEKVESHIKKLKGKGYIKG